MYPKTYISSSLTNLLIYLKNHKCCHLCQDFVHRIPLKEATTAIDIQPYRYAHDFQKAEIEKQVADMLAACVIQPSNCPFSITCSIGQAERWIIYVSYGL